MRGVSKDAKNETLTVGMESVYCISTEVLVYTELAISTAIN